MTPPETEALLESFMAPEAPADLRRSILRHAHGGQRSRTARLPVLAAALSLSFAGIALWSIVRTPGPDPDTDPDHASAVPPQDERAVRDAVKRLGSDDLTERDAASTDLRKMGPGVVPLLRDLARETEDVETRARILHVVDLLTRPTFETVTTIENDDLRSVRVAWRPDGRRIAVLGKCEQGVELIVYDASNGKPTLHLEPKECTDAIALAYTPSGATLAVALRTEAASECRVVLYAPESGEEVGRIQESEVTDVHFLTEDRLACVASRSVLIAAKDGAAWKVGPALAASDATSLAVDSRGQWLAISRAACAVDIVDIGRGTTATSLPYAAQGTTNAAHHRPSAFSRDGKWLAVPGWGGAVGVHRADSWREERVFEPRVIGRTYFSFSHDSRHLLLLGADGRLRALRCSDWEPVAELEPPPCRGMRASPADDRVLLVHDSDKRGMKLVVYRLRAP